MAYSEVEDVSGYVGNFKVKVRRKARIPIDENLLYTSLAELNELLGLGNVKNEIQELVKLFRKYASVIE